MILALCWNFCLSRLSCCWRCSCGGLFFGCLCLGVTRNCWPRRLICSSGLSRLTTGLCSSAGSHQAQSTDTSSSTTPPQRAPQCQPPPRNQNPPQIPHHKSNPYPLPPHSNSPPLSDHPTSSTVWLDGLVGLLGTMIRCFRAGILCWLTVRILWLCLGRLFCGTVGRLPRGRILGFRLCRFTSSLLVWIGSIILSTRISPVPTFSATS